MIAEFYLPTKIIFGPGSVNQLGDEARAIGRKALVVTYPDIRRVGLLDRVVDNLKAKDVISVVFDEVQPNPRSSMVDKGAGIARDEKVDLVIGLGGGSAMDAAKGIAMTAAGTKSIWYYMQSGIGVTGPVLPLIQVPTLAGSGAELNHDLVITNWETHEKRAIKDASCQARVAIIDPELTLTLPKKQTAAGGVDIFCHAVESYITTGTPFPFTDGILETTMKMAVQNLPQALVQPDNLDACTQLSWASTVAISQLARLGGGGGEYTCHGIEHALSGYYDLIHGEGLAALLLAWMRHTLPVRKERFDLLGKNVFGKADGITATEEWLEEVGMKLRLSDLGFELEHAEEIAELAVKTAPWLRFHPRPIDSAAVVQIYRDSY